MWSPSASWSSNSWECCRWSETRKPVLTSSMPAPYRGGRCCCPCQAPLHSAVSANWVEREIFIACSANLFSLAEGRPLLKLKKSTSNIRFASETGVGLVSAAASEAENNKNFTMILTEITKSRMLKLTSTKTTKLTTNAGWICWKTNISVAVQRSSYLAAPAPTKATKWPEGRF